jgi:replicative DNA helicase
MADRTSPHDNDAERSVLGSVFIRAAALDDAGDLAADDFFAPHHRDVFWAMRVLAQKREPIDPVTVADVLKVNDRLKRIEGGMSYLSELANGTPTAENARHYAKIVRDKATLRRMIAVCSDIVAQAYGERDDVGDAGDFLAYARQRLGGIETYSEDKPTLIGDEVDATIDEMKLRRARPQDYFVQSGIQAFDSKVNGLRGGNLVVIAARPGRGKSALALDFLLNAAARGTPCLLFSFEMNKTEITERALSKIGRVNGTKVISGRLHEEEWDRVHGAAARIKPLPLWLEKKRLTPPQIIAVIRRWFAEQQVTVQDGSKRRMALVAIDYLGLAKMISDEQKRERFMADLSGGLKNLAEELMIPIIAVCQLNREVEKSEGKPKLSHLRESGALEQDANMVLFTHIENEDGFDRPPMFGRGPATIIVGKNRSGPSGEVDVDYIGEYTLFTDKEDQEPIPPEQGDLWQQ